MGEVYEALDIKLNRQVALKRANADHNGDPEERKHFISEAQIAASLKHSNIMTVYALAEEAGQFYHVCELLEGKTAAHILLRNGPLTIQQCLPIVRDVCAALSYAHSKGVIHRDLKPANIMIENASAKIMDFGISRRTKSLDCRTQTLCVAGTPAYMAPEEDIGEISLQSDIYSWAVSIYELLTGQLPFAGTGARENKRAGRFMSVSSFQPKLACLDEFFKKALHPSPSQRFHDAQEFCQAFFEAAKKYEQLK